MPKFKIPEAFTNLYSFFENEREVTDILASIASQLHDLMECLKYIPKSELKFKLHKIKGELAVAGFTELAALANQLECNLIQNKDNRECHRLFTDEAVRLTQQINDWLTTNSPQ